MKLSQLLPNPFCQRRYYPRSSFPVLQCKVPLLFFNEKFYDTRKSVTQAEKLFIRYSASPDAILHLMLFSAAHFHCFVQELKIYLVIIKLRLFPVNDHFVLLCVKRTRKVTVFALWSGYSCPTQPQTENYVGIWVRNSWT